jgi:phosphate transport system permease protein
MTITARQTPMRRLRNSLFIAGSVAATLFGLVWLAMILWTLLANGASALNLNLFILETPPPPGDVGGLANAIVGSLIMIGLAVLVGAPIGIMAGTYLAEYGRFSGLGAVIRTLNDILLSAPSIVVGLFVYELVVVPSGNFSGLAGAIALAVIVIPVVVRTTENMLLLIPDTQREAASALGAPPSLVIRRVLWKAAGAGMLTGLLLAIARISGETAPLLFTALNNQFWSTDLGAPIASLPTAIYQFALSPYNGWHKLAWGGALLVTIAVLVLNIVARLVAGGEKR